MTAMSCPPSPQLLREGATNQWAMQSSPTTLNPSTGHLHPYSHVWCIHRSAARERAKLLSLGKSNKTAQSPGVILPQPRLCSLTPTAARPLPAAGGGSGTHLSSLNPTASLQLSLANRPSSFLCNKAAAHRKKGFSTHRQL